MKQSRDFLHLGWFSTCVCNSNDLGRPHDRALANMLACHNASYCGVAYVELDDWSVPRYDECFVSLFCGLNVSLCAGRTNSIVLWVKIPKGGRSTTVPLQSDIGAKQQSARFPNSLRRCAICNLYWHGAWESGSNPHWVHIPLCPLKLCAMTLFWTLQPRGTRFWHHAFYTLIAT